MVVVLHTAFSLKCGVERASPSSFNGVETKEHLIEVAEACAQAILDTVKLVGGYKRVVQLDVDNLDCRAWLASVVGKASPMASPKQMPYLRTELDSSKMI